ncbi:hypothetical protein E2C01_052884 [Portunus trituberculatus]|uniref:Uncharacterized protein n=1 Tax=Portunus trituberculatus TaxID=210409 RepID=A0A5B7GQJ6_PORTR|nr:hypothetical protein [Portunus trituberculatus]
MNSQLRQPMVQFCRPGVGVFVTAAITTTTPTTYCDDKVMGRQLGRVCSRGEGLEGRGLMKAR